MCVGKPATYGNGVLRVEDVGCGRVVDDDRVLQISSNLGQIFNVVTTMVMAALAEQPVVDNAMDVQLVEQGIAILLETCQRSYSKQVYRVNVPLTLRL